MTAPSWWGAELLGNGSSGTPWAAARQEVTVGRLQSEVARLARTLAVQGIRAGSTVAVRGVPSFTQIWAVFALWALGAQAQLLDPRLRRVEQAELLRACAPQFVLTTSTARPPGEVVFTDECEVLVQRVAGGRPAHTSHCVIQFSSGATRGPKAVGRTPESLLAEVGRWRSLDGLPAAGERVALLEPVTCSFGLIGGILSALDAGAVVIFPSGGGDRAMADAVARADVVLGNPRHLARLVAAGDGRPFPRLRLAVSGGDVLPQGTADAFRERHSVPVGQAYGTTETGIIAAALSPGPRSTVVGAPVPGVRTRVTGGVLEVHVPQSPYPYEAEPWFGGWMSTGDLVTRDPRTGALRLRGRADRAGRPGFDLVEIESALRAHTGISDAIVFGGEPVEAYVESQSDISPRELRDWCHRRVGPMAPATYRVLRQLPRTANGKIRHIRIPVPERQA